MTDHDPDILSLADMPADVRPHFAQAFKGAREQIAETGEADSAILIYGDKNLLVDSAAANEREKELVALMVRELVNLHDAHMVVHISEVWSLPDTMPTEQQKALYAQYGAISRMPEKIEQVMVQIECRDGRSWLARSDIHRKGRAVTLSVPKILDLSGTEPLGRYAGWFAPEKDSDPFMSPKP